jgi:hypothetical protein
VGRLHRTSSRLDPSLLAEGYAYAGGGVANRSERFFYDGTRRIQELITDPVVVNNEDGDVATMGEENEQRGGGGGGGGDGAGQQPGPVTTILYLKAQYVWGAGDSPTAGVDELLMQQDTNGKQWYPLQDAQGDVVSLIHMPLGAGTTQAEVAGQWTYSPYGEVLTYEQFHPHPAITHGHKGLAIDRLDAPALSWDTATSSLSDTHRLMPGATLLAYARNRIYSPQLGRWLQQDPNESGLGTITAILHHGRMSVQSPSVELVARLADGHSLYGYVRGNPLSGSDPLGLYMSPFDTLEQGAEVATKLAGILGDYALRQMDDIEWALDWKARDDEPWQQLDAVASTDDIDLEAGDGEFDEPMASLYNPRSAKGAAKFAKATTRTKDMVKVLNTVFPNFKSAQKATDGFNSRIQAHHMLPRQWNKAFEFKTLADDVPCIVLSRRQHNRIHRELREKFRELNSLKKKPSRDQVLNTLRDVYQRMRPDATASLGHIP